MIRSFSSRERKEAFGQWALPHMDRVFAASLALTRNPEEAEDLLQETYLRAFRFFHQFTPGTNCRAWLLTILANVFRNRYRAHQREAAHLDPEAEPSELGPEAISVELQAAPTPEEALLEGVLDDEVRAALDSLPEEFRAVVVLVDLNDLSYAEAASALECPVGTVRSRLARGRRLLAARLASYARDRRSRQAGSV